MPRGTPDYGNPGYQVASQQVDAGDLITAIRGVNSCDGRGRPIFFDTFGEGLTGWSLAAAGGGAAAVADTSLAEIPPVCAFLNVGGVLDTSYSLLSRTWRLGGTRSLGVEAGFNMGDGHGSMVVFISFRTPGAYLIGAVKLSYDNKFYYRNPAGAWILFDSLVTSGSDILWVPIKVVLDADLKNYKRVIVGQNNYDVSGFSLFYAGVTTLYELRSEIQGFSGGGASNKIRVGHVIVTVDEP